MPVDGKTAPYMRFRFVYRIPGTDYQYKSVDAFWRPRLYLTVMFVVFFGSFAGLASAVYTAQYIDKIHSCGITSLNLAHVLLLLLSSRRPRCCGGLTSKLLRWISRVRDPLSGLFFWRKNWLAERT